MAETIERLSQLERNMQEFERQLPRLLVDNAGKYAVGREGDNFSCWDTYEDALQYGYNLYGVDKEFVVSEVLQTPKVHTIPRLLF